MVEVLTGDFAGDERALKKIIDARPEVFAHNLETVRRLTPSVRDRRATYDQTLTVLKNAKLANPEQITKSSLMVGLGESEEEMIQAMKDLREVNCDLLTIGQYLKPKTSRLEVKEYVTPEQFNKYRKLGEELGFKYVASGPFVRSSYRAGEFYVKNILLENKEKNN